MEIAKFIFWQLGIVILWIVSCTTMLLLGANFYALNGVPIEWYTFISSFSGLVFGFVTLILIGDFITKWAGAAPFEWEVYFGLSVPFFNMPWLLQMSIEMDKGNIANEIATGTPLDGETVVILFVMMTLFLILWYIGRAIFELIFGIWRARGEIWQKIKPVPGN